MSSVFSFRAVLKESVLKILHTGRIGIVRIKSVARGSVWRLNMDRDMSIMLNLATFVNIVPVSAAVLN